MSKKTVARRPSASERATPLQRLENHRVRSCTFPSLPFPSLPSLPSTELLPVGRPLLTGCLRPTGRRRRDIAGRRRIA